MKVAESLTHFVRPSFLSERHTPISLRIEFEPSGRAADLSLIAQTACTAIVIGPFRRSEYMKYIALTSEVRKKNP